MRNAANRIIDTKGRQNSGSRPRVATDAVQTLPITAAEDGIRRPAFRLGRQDAGLRRSKGCERHSRDSEYTYAVPGCKAIKRWPELEAALDNGQRQLSRRMKTRQIRYISCAARPSKRQKKNEPEEDMLRKVMAGDQQNATAS